MPVCTHMYRVPLPVGRPHSPPAQEQATVQADHLTGKPPLDKMESTEQWVRPLYKAASLRQSARQAPGTCTLGTESSAACLSSSTDITTVKPAHLVNFPDSCTTKCQ